jgi:hypothetical protein
LETPGRNLWNIKNENSEQKCTKERGLFFGIDSVVARWGQVVELNILEIWKHPVGICRISKTKILKRSVSGMKILPRRSMKIRKEEQS